MNQLDGHGSNGALAAYRLKDKTIDLANIFKAVEVNFMLIIKLYSVLVNPLDCSDLQNNPNDLQQWSDRWQLNISYKKCNVLYLGKQGIRPRVNLVLGN